MTRGAATDEEFAALPDALQQSLRIRQRGGTAHYEQMVKAAPELGRRFSLDSFMAARSIVSAALLSGGPPNRSLRVRRA